MTEAQRIQLQQKKAQVQLMQKLQDWLPYWLPVFNAVCELKKRWSFEYFECVNASDLPFWETALQQVPAAVDIPLSAIKTPAVYSIHNQMQELYPSSLSMRYMPALPFHEAFKRDTAYMLARAADNLAITGNDEVYLFYTRFSPVLRLPFSSIGLLKEEEIMTPEDLCIMPIDGSWLIFRSLENEWVWGHKNADVKTTL